jgi:hypothetical protein
VRPLRTNTAAVANIAASIMAGETHCIQQQACGMHPSMLFDAGQKISCLRL